VATVAPPDDDFESAAPDTRDESTTSAGVAEDASSTGPTAEPSSDDPSAGTPDDGSVGSGAASDPTFTLPGVPLTQHHRAYLVGEGMAADFVDERAAAGLLCSVGGDGSLPPEIDYDWLRPENRSGILFGWQDSHGLVTWQLRPEVPPVVKGDLMKYVSGTGVPNWGIVRHSHTGPIFLGEGTKQSLAVASALHGPVSSPDELTDAMVVGMHGCWGWVDEGEVDPELVYLCQNRDVVITLDSDVRTNHRVHDAGIFLQEALKGVASDVKFIRLPGREKTGADDLLAALPEAERRMTLTKWWIARQAKPARNRPHPKSANNFHFDAWDPATGKLRVEAIADFLIKRRHYTQTTSRQLAAYFGGRYVESPYQLASDVLDLLKDTFQVGHLTNIRAAVEARTHKMGRRLPTFPDQPYANFRNGLVDLRTLELHPHTPDFRGTRQIPCDWDEDEPADRWVEWALERMGAAQLASLEEVLSQMLDPSRGPARAVFMYGPTRTGKSTVGRIARAIVGDPGRVSGVPIQRLSEPRYAAMLYGSVLNVCTDLPREALKDESGFFNMLGGDPIMADEKYGHTFTFLNAALHLFATNKIVTLSGDPGPYLDRVAPFALVKTYVAGQDPAVEERVLEQLPGICVRLAKAWQARYLRLQERAAQEAAGVPEEDRTPTWLPGHPAAVRRFVDDSDRVRRFLSAVGEPGVEAQPDIGELREVGDFSPGPQTKSVLYEAFREWCEAEGSPPMGRQSFITRLMSMPGVREIRDPATKSRLVNVGIKPKDSWDASGGSYEDLLPEIFPDEYPSSVGADDAMGPRLVVDVDDTETAVGSPTPATPVTVPTPSNPPVFDATELTALRMLSPETYAALHRVSQVLEPGSDPHASVRSAPVALLLSDLTTTVSMSAERLRALIRRLDPLLYRLGWLVRERRLTEPGVLGSAARPEFGDRDYGADRVGYSVVRATTAVDPHTIQPKVA
jgi:putative DNA primase/helicase